MAERLYYAKAGPIDPLALVMENVAIWVKANWHCYRVRYMEPVPRSRPLVFDQGVLAAGAPSGDVQLLTLTQQVDPPAMAQLRFYPVDDIQVTLKIGVAEARFSMARITATADRFTPLVDPCLHTTEVLVLENNAPYVNCTNPTLYATSMSRVAFFGFRFLLDDLKVVAPTAEEVKKRVGTPVVFVPVSSD